MNKVDRARIIAAVRAEEIRQKHEPVPRWEFDELLMKIKDMEERIRDLEHARNYST